MTKPALLLTLLLLLAAPVCAQEQSVNPGINKSFEDPSVAEFVGRFERDGREPFDHREKILEAVGLKPGMSVADIGAGTGLFTRLFAERVGKEGRIWAVDIAQPFIDHIEKTSRESGLTNVVGVVCEPDDAKLPPQSIDLAFICDTYHHFEFPMKTMRSLHRALRPGGEVVLIDFRRIEGVSSEWTLNHVRAGQAVFEQEIESAGFKKIQEHDLLKENYFVRFQRIEEPDAQPTAQP
jgi:predicted methyltransferase